MLLGCNTVMYIQGLWGVKAWHTQLGLNFHMFIGIFFLSILPFLSVMIFFFLICSTLAWPSPCLPQSRPFWWEKKIHGLWDYHVEKLFSPYFWLCIQLKYLREILKA